MPPRIQQYTSHSLILFASIICLLLITVHILIRVDDFWEGMGYSPLLQGFLMSAFLIGIGVYLKKISQKILFLDIQQLFRVLLVAGTGALILSLLPDFLLIIGIISPFSKFLFYYTPLSLFFIITFFGLSLMFFRHLIFVKKEEWVVRVWQIFLGLLILSNFFNFDLNYPGFLVYGFIGVGAVAGILLILRLNWIAIITKKVKIYSILFMVILLLISLALTQKLINIEFTEFFQMSLLNNMVLLLLVGFVNGYLTFSILALLFNLPIAAVIEEKNKEIASFRELSRTIDNHTSQDEILNLLFICCMENTKADAGWMILSNKTTGDEKIERQEGINLKDLRRIQLTVFYNREYFIPDDVGLIYIKDMKLDPYLQNHDLELRSLAVFYFNVNKNVIGKLFLAKKKIHGFDNYSLDLLQALITQTKLSLNNENLLKDALEAERFKKDMEIGKNLQKRLLPHKFPLNEKLDIAAISLAAEEVGGDYYDYFELSKNRYAFIMGDVSGKGTTAAFHVAEMKGIFQSLILSDLDTKDFIIKANQAVSNCFEKGMFITLIYLIVDLDKKLVNYSRAGHCPILYCSQNGMGIQYLQDEGLGLGIIRNEQFNTMVSSNVVKINSGDVIILYTDGVVEARNEKNNEEYGFERLKEKVDLHNKENVQQILQKVVNDVTSFAENDISRDDLSIMIIKIK